MAKVFTTEYPHHIEIRTKQDAIYHIMHMCNSCEHATTCSGARSTKCNNVKEQIKEFADKHL